MLYHYVTISISQSTHSNLLLWFIHSWGLWLSQCNSMTDCQLPANRASICSYWTATLMWNSNQCYFVYILRWQPPHDKKLHKQAFQNGWQFLKVVWHQSWNLQGILPSVKISSYSVQPLREHYNIQTGSKVASGSFNLGNSSHLMTLQSHNRITQNVKEQIIHFFSQEVH